MRFVVQAADVTLVQANPVGGTLYEVLPVITYARIVTGYVEVTWTVQPTPIQIHLTLDGQTITHELGNPVSGTSYVIKRNVADQAANAQILETGYIDFPYLYEATSARVQAETTGGTVQNLSSRVKYARWV